MRHAKFFPLLIVVLTGCAQSDQLAAAPSTGPQIALSITSRSATTENVDGIFTVTLDDVSPEVLMYINGDLQASNDVVSLERVVAEWSSLVEGSVANATLLTSQPSIGSFEQVAAFEMGGLSYSSAEGELTFSATLSEGSLEPKLKYVSVNVELPSAP